MKNIDKCLKIIENANCYTEQFKDPKLEKLISLLVLDKFLKNQIKKIIHKKKDYNLMTIVIIIASNN